MKQASFIVKKDEVDKLKTTKVETNIVETKKTITSKKPIKLVENIYYFK